MSLPESMSRVVIVGSRSQLDKAVEAVYDAGAIHLIDYTNGSDEGFSIGASMPGSAGASERLLKIRAARKELGKSQNKSNADPSSVSEIRAQISANKVEEVEEEVFAVVDKKNALLQRISDLELKQKNLELLSRLPLKLEDYRGYESIKVFAGTFKSDPSEALSKLENAEVFSSSGKKATPVAAIFIKASEADATSSVLSDYGYAEIAVPEGSGSPAEASKAAEAELAAARKELDETSVKLAELSEKYDSFITATDEELSIEVEKGEIPLRIATSDHSFVMDGWVPTAGVAALQENLEAKLAGAIHLSVQEVRGRSDHETEHTEPRFKKAPSKLKNGSYVSKFEYPTKLLSVPKYNEIDPSVIIAVFLPFFFGFMVGDAAYALPFIILGLYGILRAKSKDFKAIGTVLFFGGIWTFIFGFFFFGEMLGMHFVGPMVLDPADKVVNWQYLLGISSYPDWFMSLIPNGGHGIGKLHEVTFLLKISVYMGVVHLLLAYIVGYYNAHIQHGFKAALTHKGGWIFILVGMVVFSYSITELLFYSKPVEGDLLMTFVIGVAVLVVGMVIAWPAEKAQVIMELPGIVGNILSYTRLAAIGMSKAGMALAFNYMSIIMIASGGDILSYIMGFLIFLIGHLMIWVLAILSAGLHALRLQYVEAMNKFFVGGGTEYDPLAVKRKHTKIVETEV